MTQPSAKPAASPLGWLLIFTLDDYRRRCPECRSVIDPLARRCRRCGQATPILITVRCPVCGDRGNIPQTDLGQPFDCPTCHRSFLAQNPH